MNPGVALARTRFARVVTTPAGRIVRVIAGLGLIFWGYSLGATPAGIALMIFAFLPLLGGVFDLCPLSAVLGGPLWGKDIVREP